MRVLATFLVLVLVIAAESTAGTVLVRTGTTASGEGGYGDANWSTITGILDAATGGGVTTVGNFANNAQVQSFGALWVNTGSINGSTNLSAGEIANIQQFIASGKRVVLFGENLSWPSWNGNILSVVGGTQGGSAGGTLTTVFAHPLTAGVASINVPAGAAASAGGTSLFTQNVATLWGGSMNTLTFLDSNTLQNGFISNADNQQFGQNIASWLNASTQAPEPSSFLLMGLGLVAVSLARRRRVAATQQ